MERKKIIFFSDWFEPGYVAGGPIRSVVNMVTQLGKFHDIYVVTRITDFNSKEPYPNIPENQWVQKSWGWVKYVRDKVFKRPQVEAIFEDVQPDYVHLNSLFSPKFTLTPMSVAKSKGVKVVLAPRGMLGENSLKIKRLKKRLFLTFSKLRKSYSHVIWHASTEIEALDIQAVFGNGVRIKTAINLVYFELPKVELVLSERDKNVKGVYVSRISSIKNLKFALNRLKSIPKKIKFKFDIYGPIEDHTYWDECKDLIDKLGVEVSYKGELKHSQVRKTFQKYDFLFLPTQHENFGHVFLEAWSSGCMTLISDQTPWRGLKEKGVGYDISLEDNKAFEQAIQEILDRTDEEREVSIEKCLSFADQLIHNEYSLQQNLNLFKDE